MTYTRYTIEFRRPNDEAMLHSLRYFACYDTSVENAIKRLKDEWPDAIVLDVKIRRITV